MKTRLPFARAGTCLLLAASGALAHAGAYAQAQALQAAEPQVPVPPTRYESVLGQHAEATAAGSPDQNWVAGNQTVAATNSMALTMKNMGAHGGHAEPAPQAKDQHAGHHMPGMHVPGMHMDQQEQSKPPKEDQ